MSIFDNLGDARVYDNSKFFQEGHYIVRIADCKFIEGYKGQTFVIECNVLGAKSGHEKAPTPGQIAAQVFKADGDKRDIALSTWKGFLCVAFGLDPDELDNEEWKDLSASVLDEGSLNGTVLELQCFMKTTLKGGDFTQHKWVGRPGKETLAKFGLDSDGNPLEAD